MKKELRVSKQHIWVAYDGKTAKIGLTEYAQEQLRTILFLSLPDEGDTVKVGEHFGDVESVKKVTDLFSPVTGTVISVNEGLCDEPDEINEAPYDCWFMEIKVDEIDDALMSAEEYEACKETL